MRNNSASRWASRGLQYNVAATAPVACASAVDTTFTSQVVRSSKYLIISYGMSTDELVKGVQTRANDPKRRFSNAHLELARFELDPRWSKPYPPVSIAQVQRAEAKLGLGVRQI